LRAGDDRKARAEKAKEKYEEATKTAVAQGLPPTNPIRLGLALNYSVFYVSGWVGTVRTIIPPPLSLYLPAALPVQYEILNLPQEACTLAKTAFDDAISELDSLQEEQVRRCRSHETVTRLVI